MDTGDVIHAENTFTRARSSTLARKRWMGKIIMELRYSGFTSSGAPLYCFTSRRLLKAILVHYVPPRLLSRLIQRTPIIPQSMVHRETLNHGEKRELLKRRIVLLGWRKRRTIL
jgi:hypothetical protein